MHPTYNEDAVDTADKNMKRSTTFWKRQKLLNLITLSNFRDIGVFLCVFWHEKFNWDTFKTKNGHFDTEITI